MAAHETRRMPRDPAPRKSDARASDIRCDSCGQVFAYTSVTRETQGMTWTLANSYGGIVGRAHGNSAWCVACEEKPTREG